MTQTPYYDYQGITIYCARYEEVLPVLPAAEVDLLLADPNYGRTKLAWDRPWEWGAFWSLVNRVCKVAALQILFSQQPLTNDLMNSNRKHWRYELVWAKTMPTGFLDAKRRPLRIHETLQVFCRRYGASTYHPQMTPCPPKRYQRPRAVEGNRAEHYDRFRSDYSGALVTEQYPVDVLYFPNGHGGRKGHQTRKPPGLLRWLVASYSNPGDLVLDPGMGGGTALVAAKELGRRAIGIDMREECCAAAVKALAQGVYPLTAAA